jgi:TPR repeat protein
LVSALDLGKGTDSRQARHWFEKAARRGYAPAHGSPFFNSGRTAPRAQSLVPFCRAATARGQN